MPKTRTENPQARVAWYAWLRAHTALEQLFERELDAACGMSLAYYDVLILLWREPERRMRMSELADQVLLSRSWLTRRIDQMEADGLVARCTDPHDGRVVLAKLTSKGVRAFVRAERAHARAIEQHFSQQLSRSQVAMLLEVMDALDARTREVLRGEREDD